MSMKEEHIDKAEKYLRGELTSAEAEDFEQKIADNRELRETFTFLRDVNKGIEIGTIRNLKSRLQKVDKGNRGKYKWVAIAASIALLATIGVLVVRTANVDSQRVYEKYYSPYPNVVAPASRSATAEKNAYMLYEQGKYTSAIKEFRRKEKSDTVRFYLGQSHLALGKEQAALEQFRSIDDQSSFFPPAQWYEVLIFIKQKDKDSAIELLNEIIQSDSDYSAKAKEIKGLL